jgi:hypothetical protein
LALQQSYVYVFVLVRLFRLPRIPLSSERDENKESTKILTDTSISYLQTAVGYADGFDTTSILKISALHSAVDRENEENALRTNGSIPNKAAAAMKEWTDYVTLSHAEVSTCITEILTTPLKLDNCRTN